jgi:16S rRNA (guanine1207-N2)-methyltransferase
MLLAALPGLSPPVRVLDLGCGIGALGLAALARWPGAEGCLLDGDARAVASARHNARALDVQARCRIEWWDANEPCPDSGFDLVLLNPPFHTGKGVDLAPARTLFRRASEVLSPRGRTLIVANRTLPWERDLSALGRLETLQETRGYKLLSVSSRRTSASSSTRKRPGSRSAGRS